MTWNVLCALSCPLLLYEAVIKCYIILYCPIPVHVHTTERGNYCHCVALWCVSCVCPQAAKADPFNPDVFVYIGHYQRLVAGDIRYCT